MHFVRPSFQPAQSRNESTVAPAALPFSGRARSAIKVPLFSTSGWVFIPIAARTCFLLFFFISTGKLISDAVPDQLTLTLSFSRNRKTGTELLLYCFFFFSSVGCLMWPLRPLSKHGQEVRFV